MRRQQTGHLLTSVTATMAGSAAGAAFPFVATHLANIRQTDSYFLASGVLLVVSAVMTAVLRPAVVPIILEWSDTTGISAWKCLRRLALQTSVASGLMTTVGMICFIYLIVPGSNFDAVGKRFAVLAAVILIPLPSLMAACATISSALFAHNRYFIATVSEAFRTLFAIVGLVLAPDDYKMIIAAAFMSVGELFRLLLLFGLSRKLIPDPPGTRTVSMGGTWKRLGPQLLAMAITAVNPVVDRLFAARLDPGSITILELAEKLFYVPVVLIGGSIGAVYGTRWAHAARTDVDLRPVIRGYQRTLLKLGVATGILTAVLIVSALAFPHTVSTFAGIDDPRLTHALAIYAIGLPFAIWASLGGRMMVAIRMTTLLPLISIFLLVVNTAGDAIGAMVFGVAGIAASSSLCRFLQGVTLFAIPSYSVKRAIRERTPSIERENEVAN